MLIYTLYIVYSIKLFSMIHLALHNHIRYSLVQIIFHFPFSLFT